MSGPLKEQVLADLAAAGCSPLHRFGQNFMVEPQVVEDLIAAAGITAGARVLEVGPGTGVVTTRLLDAGAEVLAVEIDRGLAARLVERYADRPHVRVVTGDVLELPIDAMLEEPHATVVANLPYNVTTPILFRLLDLRARFPRAVVMVQREVATRLAARPGGKEWGVLPALIQTFAEVRVAFGVSRRAFHPPPRVESAVLDVRWSAAPRVALGDVETYRTLVRAAFGQRRKTLRNALAGWTGSRGLAAGAVAAAFAVAAIDPGTRAERLSTADFARLARAFEDAAAA